VHRTCCRAACSDSAGDRPILPVVKLAREDQQRKINEGRPTTR
jgi:hypothetical protein